MVAENGSLESVNNRRRKGAAAVVVVVVSVGRQCIETFRQQDSKSLIGMSPHHRVKQGVRRREKAKSLTLPCNSKQS